MSIGFKAAKVADGLTGIAYKMAYGGTTSDNTGQTTTLRNAGQSVVNLGSALLNAFNLDNFRSSYNGGWFGQFGTSTATGGNPCEWLNQYIRKAWSDNGLVQYLYQKLFHDLMPDISGYTLLFMIPPDLSGYRIQGNMNYMPDGNSFVFDTCQLIPLLATNFVPPTIQLGSNSLAGPAGTQHQPTKLSITDSMSVSYIENMNLDVYSFHSTWIKYIFQVLEGTLDPAPEYITERIIDYAASFYFVKFMPNMSAIQYVGKAVGCVPRETPTQDVIGN